MRPHNGSAGFALVETLVGLAILSGVLIATYASLSQALVVVQRLAERRDAVQQVQQQVDALRRQRLLRAHLMTGSTSSFRWSVSVERAGGTQSRMVMPFRVIGRIARKPDGGTPETVLDTVLLGLSP